MNLSERLTKECDRITSRQYMGADRWVNTFAHSTEVRVLLAEAIELAKRYEDAATGECMEVGDLVDCDGQPFIGAIIESTREELKRGPGIVYKRVRIVLDKEG